MNITSNDNTNASTKKVALNVVALWKKIRTAKKLFGKSLLSLKGGSF